MSAPDPCPICRLPEHVSWLMRKNGHELYRCAACDHIFVQPIPTDEELQRLYSFASGYQKQPTVSFAAKRSFARKFLTSVQQVGRHVRGGTVLDVGCSSGEFLWLARRSGYDVQGVELSPDTAAIARSNGLPVFVGRLDDADFAPASFSAVHLGDVIEHVTDPESLLHRVHALLQPGGVVLVVTPNHDAFFPRTTLWFFRTLGVPWSHPAPPFHLNQFSVASLTELLRRTGFRIAEERYDPCSLLYELRATRVFGELREALQARQAVRAASASLLAALVTVTYTGIWFLDRVAFFKRKDFTMRFVAVAQTTV